eukprot:scaffold10201_cov143-Chaetoceros_neogracile.AAC.3
MAARNSCTHLTWADAKDKTSSNTGGGKKPLIPKKIDHGKALTAKIISKNSNTSQSDRNNEKKTLLKRIKRDEEKSLIAASKRSAEKERERKERLVKPFEQANERMMELAKKLQQKKKSAGDDNDSDNDPMDPSMAEMQRVAECRELQLNEVLGLEAIYADTNELLVSHSSDLESLQQHIEQWQMYDSNEQVLKAIGHSPPVSFTLQLTVDGTCHSDASDDNHNNSTNSRELAASLLLQVTLPALYPLDETSVPVFDVAYFIVTDRGAVCNPDKALETLAHLEEGILKDALIIEAKLILPDPCVYEVVTSYLQERLFDYVRMSVHAQHVQHYAK